MKLVRDYSWKAFVSLLVIISILFSVAMPAYALGSFTVEYTTRGKKYIMSDGTINGTYTGDDGSSITWTLTPKGALTVSGSGCLPHIWLDPDNNPIAERIKTVTINSGITALDNGTFFQCSNMTKVTLPSSVTSIGFAAFASCPNLASIIIPSNITYIGEYAFYSCTALQSILLPNSVTLVDTEAFANCTALTSAEVYGDIGTDAFNNCTSLSSLTLGGSPEYIGDRAFAYCESLTSVDIPGSVLEVGVGAFAYCEKMTSAITSGNLSESAFDCCYALKDVELGEYCTSIGRRCFSDCKALENITIPENVTEICDAAFQNCSSLKAISIPESVELLGNFAFYGCKELAQVSLPTDLTVIEQCLFAYCEKLELIALPSAIKTIESGAFGYCSSITSIDIPAGCKTVAEKAFFGCQKLQSISIPDTVNSIGDATFYECKELRGVSIPQGIRTIPDHAFAFCESLSAVSLPAGLINIGSYAFTSCKKLGDVTLPSSLEGIGEYAFYECEAINSISVPQKVTVIPEGTFAMCSALKNIALPTTLMEIDKAAFIKCEALESIEIPDAVNYLGLAAFAGCKNLSSITLPAGITEILDSTFLDCAGLKNVSITGSITSIGDYSFASCESLEGIALPVSVMQIGKQAFSFCEKLSSLSLPDNLLKIGKAAFLNCAALKSLALGSNVQEIGDDAFAACTSLTTLTLDSRNRNFVIASNVLYNANKTRLISLVPANNPVSISIPNTVTEMGELTFYCCDNIESVTLPSYIKEIGSLMFYSCSDLQSVVIPEGVTKIGAYAFSDCEKLNEVNIPSSVQSIEEGAFNNCKRLQSVEIPSGVSAIDYGTFLGCKSLNNIILPSSVTKIDSYAFAQCDALSNVQLPQNLSVLGEYAFASCDSLADMNLPESLASIGEGAFAECSTLTNVALPPDISHVSDFLFYDCPSLESVYLRGGVFAIGVGSFSSSESLSKVIFAGNAPEVIGARAFEKTSGDLVLHYEQAATGWTTPKWTGPDEAVYNTNTVYSGTCGEKLEWNLVTATGELTVWGSGEMYDWDVTDTAKFPPWKPYMDMIKHVIIQEGVTSIGASAFRNSPELLSVSIPSTVNKVGYAAFADCLRLNEVECNGGLKVTSECMFYNDDQLLSINLAEGLTAVSDYAFYGCCNLDDIIIPFTVKTIGQGAFASCISIGQVTFRGQLNSIEMGAFFNCTSLKRIIVNTSKPKNVGEYAFFGCNPDISVLGGEDPNWLITEPSTVMSYQDAFVSSGNAGNITWQVDIGSGELLLTGVGNMSDYSEGTAPWIAYSNDVFSIVIDSGITSIGSYAFSDMENVNSISIPNSVNSIGSYAMAGCSSLRFISLPSELKTLGEGVFSGCIILNSISLPSGIKQIPNYTFNQCYSLENVDTSEVIEIGYGAFHDCINLKDLPVWSSIRKIYGWAFTNCSNITSIELVQCTYIGEYAFAVCDRLTDVILGSDLDTLGNKAFTQTNISKICIPSRLRTVTESAFELCDNLEQVEFSDGTYIIEKEAFYGCRKLTNISFENIVSIGIRAFMATGLEEIVISSSVNNIGFGAFADCVHLDKVQCNSSNYYTINNVLYSGNTLLQFPAGLSIGSFTVPEGIMSIADNAFFGCGKLIDINCNQVKKIGIGAFVYCTGLHRITIGADIAELSEGAFALCHSLDCVRFMGDSPSLIGEDAFYHTSDSLILQFVPNKEGWTDGIWIGPDGNSYSTCVLEDESSDFSINSIMNESDQTICVEIENSTNNDKDVLFIAALYRGEQFIKAKILSTQLLNNERKSLSVSYNKSVDKSYHICIYLLDAYTYSPLCRYSDISDLYVHNYEDAELISIVENCNTLTGRGFNTNEFVETQYFSSTPASLIDHSISAGCEIDEIYIERISLSSRGLTDGVQQHTVTSITAKMQDIEQYPKMLVRGEEPQLDPQTEDKGMFDVGFSAEIKTKVINLFDPVDRCIVGSHVNPDGTTVYEGRVVANGSFQGSLGGISQDGYIYPNVKAKVSYSRSIRQSESEPKKWNAGSYKIEYKRNTTISEIHGEGKAEIGNGKVLDIGVGGGYDWDNMENSITLSSNSGEIGSIKVNVGAGVSGKIGAKVSNGSITFSCGLKKGVGGGVEFTINIVNLIKAWGDPEVYEGLFNNHLFEFLLYNINKQGDEELLGTVNFTMIDEEITSYYFVPSGLSRYIPGDSVYGQALPKSQGATIMPTDSTQQQGQQTGVGGVNTSGKNNNLSKEEQDAIKKATESIGAAIESAGYTSESIINQKLQEIPTNYDPKTVIDGTIKISNERPIDPNYTDSSGIFHLHAVKDDVTIDSVLDSMHFGGILGFLWE